MEKQTYDISEEVLAKVKSLPRIDFQAFKELIKNGTIKRIVKLKKPRTIFFDEETQKFLYINPYYKNFSLCGIFKEEEV